MDRLERQNINPYTVPGLLPGLLGIAMILLGGVLALRSWRRGALELASSPPARARQRAATPHLDRHRPVHGLRRRADRPRPAVLAGVDDLRHRLDPDPAAPEPRRRTRGAWRSRPAAKALAIGLGVVARSPTWCSRSCSWCACPDDPRHAMFQGLSDLGHAYLGFMNPTDAGLRPGRRASSASSWASCPACRPRSRIALLTTLTIKLQANDAILVLICSYVGALYGGSRTAILLNIPGTAANAASCADGYALAQEGRGRPRDRHRDVRRLRQHAVRRAVPGRPSRRHWPRWRCRSAPSSSSGWRCSASRCRAASSATIRSRAG